MRTFPMLPKSQLAITVALVPKDRVTANFDP
jgi:hypothetical protein